jgi:exopolysaccharide production protein ExoQ
LNGELRQTRRTARPVGPSLSTRWHYWVAGYFLMAALGVFGFVDRMVYGNWSNKSGDKITATFQLLLFLSSAAIFIHGYRRKRRVGTGGTLALVATGFLFATALWSTVPETSMREAVIYFFIVLGSIGIANSLDGDEFMDLLGWACFISAIGSLLLLIVAPDAAHGGDDDVDFQGLFTQKNVLGQVMLTGAITSLHALRSARRDHARHLGFLLVFAVVALASQSATACLGLLTCCVLDRIVALYQRRGAARVIAVSIAVTLLPALVLAITYPDPILELLGKDISLTGRTELWDYVMDDIWRKPWLGWGYFGFWTPLNPDSTDISNAVGWVVPHAHNGVLEMLLEIGFIGTGIYVFLLLRNTVLAFWCLGTPGRSMAISALLCNASILIIGVSEAVLLASNQSSTNLFFITGMMCERGLRAASRHRHRTAPGAVRGRITVIPPSRFSKAG